MSLDNVFPMDLRYIIAKGNTLFCAVNLPTCVVCLTVRVPSPYSSIPREKTQSYVVLIEFEWNGLTVSEVNNLKNRKFLEPIASHPNL